MTGRRNGRQPIRVRWRRAAAILVAGFALLIGEHATPDDLFAMFTDEEIERISAHGPWPPAPYLDPGNPWSGEASAIVLGERLFGDPRLSTDSAMSCATCHQPDRAFTDGRERGLGWRVLERNTPTLLNIAFTQTEEALTAGSLRAQSVRPLLSPAEMNTTPGHLRRLFSTDDVYREAFSDLAAQPAAALADARLLAVTGKVLAAYQQTLVTPRTPFDDFRDALVAGDPGAAALYPAAAQRGLRVFVGRAGCTHCHAGPAFSQGGFGFAGIGAGGDREGSPDSRPSAEATLLPEPFRDWTARVSAQDASTGHGPAVVGVPGSVGSVWIRVPGLRAVSRTAPYLHDGSIPTLERVVRSHSSVELDEAEIADLVAFLRTL